MYQLFIENKYKRKLELTNNSNYAITSIDGITTLGAELFTSEIAFKDGKQFKNAKINERALTITIALLGSGFQVEQSRIALYDFITPGQMCIIYFKNETRNCYINAYVENFEINPFEKNQTAQISLVATNPYWIDVNPSTIDASKKHGNIIFPLFLEKEGEEFSTVSPGRVATIINRGAKKTGFVITVKCLLDGISNPIFYDYKTGEFIKLNISMKENDVIKIDTIDKKITLLRDLKETNLIAYKTTDSTWLTLEPGVNLFAYNTEISSEFLEVVVEHNTLYTGV